MTWENLLRPPLREIGAYEPGEPLDELMARHGLSTVDKLNWNEGLWGPLPGVLDATAGALDQTWAYPEHAFNALREAIAADTGAPPEQVLPGHGIQALILTLVNAFVSPGDAVVVPAPTYGLYAQACRVAGARVERVGSPELGLDLEAIAAAVRATGAKLVWICDPNNPTGLRLAADEWRAFLDAVGPGCVVVADEAYMDFADPSARADRLRDVVEGRPVVVIRSFSKVFGLAGLRLGVAIADPAVARLMDVVQEPFNVNRAALAAGRAAVGLDGFLVRRRAEVAAARDALREALAGHGLVAHPSQANFVLVELGVDDGPVCDALLARGVLVRPGKSVGLPGTARVTVAPAPLMERVAAMVAQEVERAK